MNINIPDGLYKRFRDILPETEYDSVDNWILGVLRYEVAKHNAEKDNIGLSEDEEERVKERLKQLGYL